MQFHFERPIPYVPLLNTWRGRSRAFFLNLADDSLIPIPFAPESNTPNVSNSILKFPKAISGHCDRFCLPSGIRPMAFLLMNQKMLWKRRNLMAVTPPQTCFVRICNQILDAAMHPRKQKKQVRNKRARSSNFKHGPSKNRRIFLILLYR